MSNPRHSTSHTVLVDIAEAVAAFLKRIVECLQMCMAETFKVDHVIKQRRFTYPFPRTRRHAAAAQRVPSGASISACNESGSYSQCSCGPESDCWKRPMPTLAEEAAVAQEGSSSRPLHADVWEGEHVPPARTRAPGPALGGCREAADDEMRRGFEGRVSSHFVAGNREGGVTSESGPGSRHTSWISMPAAGYCGGPDFDLATGGRVAEQGREADDYAMMRPAPVSPRSCSGSHRSSAPSSFEADRPYSLSGDTGPVSTNQQCRIQRGVALVRSASEALPTASATRHPPQAPHRHSFSAHRGSHGVLSGLFLLPARAGEGRPPKLPCVSPTATASAEPSGSSAASRPEQQRRRSEAELPLFEPDAPAQQGSTQSTPSSSQCGCPVALQVCDSESGGCIRDALVVSSDGTPTGNETDEDDFKGKRYIRAILQLIPELYSRHPPVLSLLLHDSHLPFFFPLHIAEVAAFASLLVQQPPEVASALRSACLHAAPSSGEMAQRQAPAEELEPTTWQCGRRAGRNCRDRRGGDGGRRNETPPLSGSFLSAEQTGRIRPRRSGECFAGAEKRVDAHQTYRAENAGQFVSERRHRSSSYESTTQREDDGLEKDEEIEPTPEGLPRSSRTRSVLSHGDDLPRVTRAVSWCSVSSLRSCRTSCSASPDSPGDPLEGSDTRSPSPLAPFSRAGYDTLESPVKQALWDAVSRYTSWASTEFSLSSLSSLARAANPLKTEGEVVVCRMNSSSSPGIRLPVSRMPSNAPTSSQMIVDRGASACRADAARIIQKGDARAAGTTRSPRRSASSGCSSLLISCCSATFVEWDSVPTATENQQSISQGFHSSFNSLPASCSSRVGIPASRDEAQLSDLQLRQAVTSSVAVSSSGGVPLLSGASERRVFPLRLPFHSAGSCPSLALPANRGEVWFLPDVGGDSHLEQKQFGPRACGLPSSAYGQTERERAKEAGFETSVWLHGCKDAHDAKERPRTECICPASWRREASRGGATSASAPWVSPEGTSDRRLAKPPEGGLAGRSKPDEGEQCWRVATRVCVARAPVICPSSSSFDASRISCLPSAASAAASGGASSACVMYADLWALFAGQQVPPIPLSQYVSRLQRLSQISAHECLIALLLISRVLCRRPYLPFCALNAYRLLLTACMVVTKAFSDSFYTNAMWARFGGVTVTELNRLEYAFLLLLDHQCFVTLDEFAAAFCLVKDVSRALPVDVCGLISARGQTFLEGTSDLLSSSLAPPSTAGVSPRAHATERPSPKRCMGSDLGRQYEELGASTAGCVPEGRAAAVGVSRADPRTRFASVAKSGDVSMPSPSASSPTTAFSGPCAAPSPGSPPHARLLVHSPSTQLCRGASSVSLSVCGNLVSTGLLASDMMDASPSCVGVDLSRHRGGRSRLSALPCSAGVFRQTQPRLFGKSPRRRGGRGKPTSPTLQSHAPCNQSRQSFPSGAPETLPRSRWLRRSSAFGAAPAHRSSWARGRRCRSHLSRGGCCAVSAQPQLPPRCSPSAFPASPGGAFAHETGTGRRLVESPEAVAQKRASSRRSSGPMDAGRASVHGERSWGQKSERKGAVEGESDDPAVAVKGAVDPVFYERLLILRACSLSFLRAHVKRVAGFEMKERQEGRPMGEATAGRGKGCRCAETAAAELDGLRVVSTPCGVLGHPARQPSSTHSEAGRETGMGDGTAQGSDRRESEMSRCGEEERYPRGLPFGSAGRRETTYKGGGHAEERQRQLAEAFNSVDWRVIENPVASLLFSSHPVMNASPFSP
ncbi:hypothetical protein BESB_011190 [Besnoitia besnoiti]|uniref:Cyclin, N-terminal domain-containing protein n=1 Tax=Besnoitia besnoiti TaxID=94643 RepID=A0A2A9MQX0_BESBE|nr:hypothetical protein BESB_011190 [Besnoitia besnoiti]PFH38777.1 hypothetical protein BESB_011190 [Besnoitia besnoiti]